MNHPTVYVTSDPKGVVIEVEGFGHGIATGEPPGDRYLYLIRTRHGWIVHFKDYWNPRPI